MSLLAIHRYPIKSFAGQSLREAEIGALGIAGDRRWMLIDRDNRFVSARERPALLRWQVEGSGLDAFIRAPDGERIPLAVSALRIEVSIWKDQTGAWLAEPAVSAAISAKLDADVRLVWIEDPSPRAVNPSYGRAGDTVSFADGFPILLLSEASHRELQRRLGRELSILRFRPNLIVSADRAHAEDDWRSIRIGECEFDLVNPCTRCVLTTIDPETAMPDADREPLRTLMQYRRSASGVTFGQNLIPRKFGRLRVGDNVEVLERLL